MPIHNILQVQVLDSLARWAADTDTAAVVGLSSGRIWSGLAVVVGLVVVVCGALAIARAHRRGALVTLGAGAIVTAIGVVVVATAGGGPGTGFGIVGGYLAAGIGAVALILGAIALRRSSDRTA